VRALAVLVALGTVAQAHDIPPRVDRLRIDARGLTLECTIAVAGDDARELRERFDTDGNGELDKNERLRVIAYLRQHATAYVRLTVDGKDAGLALASEEIELGSSLLTLTARWRASLAAGEHRLLLDDRAADARLEIPVSVELDAAVARAVKPPFPARVFAGHPLDLTIRYRTAP
jgi:hypothetical protein